MNISTVLLVIPLLFTSVSAGLVPAPDQSYVSKDLGFRITFPPGRKELVIEHDSTALEGSSGYVYTHSFDSNDSCDCSLAYMTVTILPGNAPASELKSIEDDIVKGTEAGTLKTLKESHGGVVEKGEDADLQGHVMRTIQISIPDTTLKYRYCTYRWIAVGMKLYTIVYMAKQREDLQQSAIKEFFDSFALL